MKKTGLLLSTAAAALVLGAATQAHTAGYGVKETSGTQPGQAFAGSAALSGDLSAMWNNPATMTSLAGNQITAAASLIIPSAKFKDGGGSTANGGNGGNAGKAAVVPALYAMWSAMENLKVGLAITSPYGLKTQFKSDWQGRFGAIKSAMKTVNINPNLAYKINDYVSVGAGVSAQHVDLELTKKVNNRNFAGAVTEGDFKATGTDWAYGFNIGALFKMWEGSRFGVSYRSKIKHTLRGETKNSGIHVNANNPIAGVNVANGITKIDAKMTTPESIDFSFAQDLGEAWTVMASAVWTKWSAFKTLEIKRKDRTGPNGGTVGTPEAQNWKNVWFLSLGANWKVTENWMLRAGVAYDQSPIKDEFRTAKLPGNDRTWLSFGVDWTASDWAKVGLTYTHVFMKKAKMNKLDGGNTLTAFAGDRTQGTFKSKVDIIGLQASFKF